MNFRPLRSGPVVSVSARVQGGPDVRAAERRASPTYAQNGKALTGPPILASPQSRPWQKGLRTASTTIAPALGRGKLRNAQIACYLRGGRWLVTPRSSHARADGVSATRLGRRRLRFALALRSG